MRSASWGYPEFAGLVASLPALRRGSNVTALVDLIESTVKLEQPLSGGLRTVGTGFLVADTAPDGTPRTVLITAHHVFDRMPDAEATLGLRVLGQDDGWRYSPQRVTIRDADGAPLWTHHPVQDIAAIEIPKAVASRAIPIGYLARGEPLDGLQPEPGDELLVLGFPLGVSANPQGFPILRSGRVASYPLAPASRYPTFLLDFSVYAGNSGGPVFVNRAGPIAAATNGATVQPIVVGVLTQQIQMEGDRLAIGNVTQARYVIETLSLLNGEEAVVAPTMAPAATGEKVAASEAKPPKAGLAAAGEWLANTWWQVTNALRRTWIVIRDKIAARTTALPVAYPPPP